MQSLDLPELAIVRVITSGGPYEVDDELSVAFNAPSVGRLARHGPSRDGAPISAPSVVPESLTVVVTAAAGPYRSGDRLTLWFVDPAIARIHPNGGEALPVDGRALPQTRAPVARAPEPAEGSAPEDAPLLAAIAEIEAAPAIVSDAVDWEAPPWATYLDGSDQGEPVREAATSDARARDSIARVGVRVTLEWSADRAQRFIRVVDKLFTVDRLGWYRHVLAMRLLIPDAIETEDASAGIEVGRQLQALRTAASETLGRPLLAACMPNFSVTAEWLDDLDNVAAARATGALRDALLPYVDDDATVLASELEPKKTLGVITRRELLGAPPSSVDAFVPLLVASVSPVRPVCESLTAYRSALIDGFNQTARSVKAVRLNAMAQSNCVLDDRLWQLVGTIGESFGELPTSS